MKKAIFGCLLICSLTISYAFAAESEDEVYLDKIVVTPTLTEEDVSTIGSSVSVISGKALQGQGIYSVDEALKEDASIDVVQSGTYVGTASIFLRGANAGQTRIMLDGIRLYDPIAPNAAFNPAYLMLDNISRIEIVKGPQSSLYGSDAMGGVINMISKKGKGKPKVSVLAEGGTYSTHREVMDFSGAIDKLHFSLSLSNIKTAGLKKLAQTTDKVERNPYENQAYSMRLDYDLNDESNLGLINNYTYAKYKYDDWGGAGNVDINRWGWTRQDISSIFLNQKINDNLSQKIQLSWLGNYRRDFDEDDANQPSDFLRDWYYGESQQADWQMSLKVADYNTILSGFNYLRERGESYYYSGAYPPASVFPKSFTSTKGYFIEDRFNFKDKATSTLSYRVEDHSRFHTNETYKVDALYKIDKIDTKIKSSFGTGFKAPTLYQLFAPPDAYFAGGNANLKPEKSYSYEFGLEQPLYSEKVNLGLTFFHTDFKNLIDSIYNPNTYFADQYKNVSKARSMGYEAEVRVHPFKNFNFKGSYALTDTEDKETHLELLRRAKNKVNLNLDYKYSEKLDLNLNMRYVGSRFDSGYIKLKPYAIFDFSANYDINENFIFYARLENMFNKKYEELKGYATPGASIYAGIKATF